MTFWTRTQIIVYNCHIKFALVVDLKGDTRHFLQRGWHSDDPQVFCVDGRDCLRDDALQVRQVLMESRDIKNKQRKLNCQSYP